MPNIVDPALLGKRQKGGGSRSKKLREVKHHPAGEYNIDSLLPFR